MFFRRIASRYPSVVCQNQVLQHSQAIWAKIQTHTEKGAISKLLLKVYAPSSILVWLTLIFQKQNDYKEMIHSPHWRWSVSFCQKIILKCIQLCQLALDEQVLNFIDNCGGVIGNTRTGNGRCICSLLQRWRGELICEEEVVQTKKRNSLYNPIPFLTRRHASKWPDLECKIAHRYLIKKCFLPFDKLTNHNLLFCLKAVSGAIALWTLFLLSTWTQSSLLTTQGECLWLIPKAFLIKCDWIEPSVPRRRANLYLAYFLFLHFFLFSPQQGVCGEKRRPVNCLHPPICTSFPPVGVRLKHERLRTKWKISTPFAMQPISAQWPR